MAGKRKKAPRTTISSILPRWLDENGLTLADASRRLDTPRKTLERWRDGEFEPWDKDIPALAKKMSLPLEAFYPEPGPVETGVLDRLESLQGRFDLAEEDLLDRITTNTRRLSAIESGIDEIRELLVALIGSNALAESLPEAVQRRRDDLVRALETSQRTAAEARPETRS